MVEPLGTIHDVVEELAATPSAIANLCVLGAQDQVGEHAHANPYLWLYVLGAYAEAGDAGEGAVRGPAAVFFPSGSAHGMAVRDQGLVSVIVEFDEAALRRALGPNVDLRRPRLWIGGVVGRHAQHLARLWLGAAQPQRFAVSEAFLAQAMRAPQQRPAPRWLDDFDAGLDADEPAPSTAALAKRFDLTTSWIARAYRHWRGEGMGEALRRRRVERAAVLFETRDAGLADIALDAGFCDQSHMNRAFKRILGRTPAAVRAARLGLAGSQPRFASGRPMG